MSLKSCIEALEERDGFKPKTHFIWAAGGVDVKKPRSPRMIAAGTAAADDRFYSFNWKPTGKERNMHPDPFKSTLRVPRDLRSPTTTPDVAGLKGLFSARMLTRRLPKPALSQKPLCHSYKCRSSALMASSNFGSFANSRNTQVMVACRAKVLCV